ncbi:EamA family transporter [Candidatus Omnitrophota bacterium]
MNWFVLALICAFATSITDAVSKIALRQADEYVVGFAKMAVAAPVFLLGLIYFIEVPKLDTAFWIVVVCLMPLEVFSYILYLKAIKTSPLSLTVPYLAFTPVFAVLTAFILLGEKVTATGMIGILCVAAGSYFLNIDVMRRGPLEPIRAIFREKGSIYMLIVAFTFSFTAVLGKLALKHSGWVFFPAFYYIILCAAMIPIIIFRVSTGRSVVILSIRQAALYALLGLVFVISVFAHFAAISMVNVAYMISVKRLSLLFGVILGGIIFKEKKIAARLGAALLMFLGAALIVSAR